MYTWKNVNTNFQTGEMCYSRKKMFRDLAAVSHKHLDQRPPYLGISVLCGSVQRFHTAL